MSMTELSGWLDDQTRAEPAAASAPAPQAQATLRRSTSRTAPFLLSSSPKKRAPANQIRPSGRMLISTSAPMPSRASRRFSRYGSGLISIGSPALQTRMPAAISGPLGLTTPNMNRAIGVAAVITPSRVKERLRHSAAETTALATRAEQISADIRRIR